MRNNWVNACLTAKPLASLALATQPVGFQHWTRSMCIDYCKCWGMLVFERTISHEFNFFWFHEWIYNTVLASIKFKILLCWDSKQIFGGWPWRTDLLCMIFQHWWLQQIVDPSVPVTVIRIVVTAPQKEDVRQWQSLTVHVRLVFGQHLPSRTQLIGKNVAKGHVFLYFILKTWKNRTDNL